MQEEESDDSEGNGYVYKTVHYYDESPDSYAEYLCSNEDDDYEYQEQLQSLKAMELYGSDSDTTSDDEESTLNNLYELSSDRL